PPARAPTARGGGDRQIRLACPGALHHRGRGQARHREYEDTLAVSHTHRVLRQSGRAAYARRPARNVARQQRLGIATESVPPSRLPELLPGCRIDDIGAAAWEPDSGFADPNATDRKR